MIAREFGLTFLKPMLFQFAEDHPQIDLMIDFDDRTVDLEAENYDLAVRVTATELKGLNCYRIGTTRRGLFASRSYAEAKGLPKTVEQLTDHPLLHYGGARRTTWEFEDKGRKRSVTFRPALRLNYGSFLVDAALRDAGIIRLPLFVVEEQASAGRLIPVLDHLKHKDYGIYVVHSANRRLNERMRMMMDALEKACLLPG